MMTCRSLLMLIAVLSVHGDSEVTGIEPVNYEFAGGRWFDGEGFKPATFYSVGGALTSAKPARIDRSLDLTGKYVIPPFGEAHNHNVESSRADAMIQMYLQAGIFYVKNPNSLIRFTTPLLDKVNKPGSIDVLFANGGLTGTGGHPVGLVRRNIERQIWTEADGEGAFVFIIDSVPDLDRQWEKITTGKPNFIKTYLLYSEEYAKRKADDAYFDWRGLDPSILPEIVSRAHAAGLRVSTHVESAADFHHAVQAGADEINHLPGFRPDRNDLNAYREPARYRIAEADARLAGERGVFVVSTVGPILEAIQRV